MGRVLPQPNGMHIHIYIKKTIAIGLVFGYSICMFLLSKSFVLLLFWFSFFVIVFLCVCESCGWCGKAFKCFASFRCVALRFN